MFDFPHQITIKGYPASKSRYIMRNIIITKETYIRGVLVVPGTMLSEEDIKTSFGGSRVDIDNLLASGNASLITAEQYESEIKNSAGQAKQPSANEDSLFGPEKKTKGGK